MKTIEGRFARVLATLPLVFMFTGSVLAAETSCKFIEDGTAVEQYEACTISKSAALNAVIELIAKGDISATKEFLLRLRKEHPNYSEVVELLSATNSVLDDEKNLMELVSVLAKVKMQSLFESVDIEPFNLKPPKKETLPPLELVRGKFEKTIEFEARLLKAKGERQRQQSKINFAYEKAVGRYNRQLNMYKSRINLVIDAHKKEVRKNYDQVLINAFKLVMGESSVGLADYNPDEEVYYAKMKFANLSAGQNIALKRIRPSDAKSFEEAFRQNNDLRFDIVDDNFGFLEITNIVVDAGNQSFNFEYSDTLYLADSKRVIIDDGDSLLSTSQLEELDINVLTSATKEELDELYQRQLNAQFAFNNQAANLSKYAINLISTITKKSISRDTNAVAVIIGNRDYKTHNRDIEDVEYAINDAALIRAYVKSKLGIADEDIIYRENTSQSDLNAIFGNENNANGKLSDYVNDENTKVFVFYSGHGTLGLKDKYSYIIPVGANPNNIELTGYKLDTLYANLQALPTDDITVVVDACFSGQSNNATLLKNASAVYGKPKDKFNGKYDFNIFSATSAQQIASWDVTNKLGIFTKHFVEGAMGDADFNGDNKVTLAELKKHLTFSVAKEARREYDGRQQTPQVLGKDEKVLSEL